MENEFIKVMSERSDGDLVKIVTVDRDKYQPLAVATAEAEIEKRHIDIANFGQFIAKAKFENEQINKVDSNVVSSGIRFVNFLIDFTVCMFTAFIMSVVLVMFFQPMDSDLISLIGFMLMFGTFMVYYVFMETRFQKTLGKFVTKTKVVKKNGEKPTSGDIIMRTFCRLVPFDRISFLFVRNGIHDFLSNTKVVKDNLGNTID
jgi:uncharacterized RDD family membrane protein YckC